MPTILSPTYCSNPAALNIENLGDADYLIPGGVCDGQAAGIWKEVKARVARANPILRQKHSCGVLSIFPTQ